MSVDLNLVNLTKPCFVRIVARFWVPSNGGSAGGGSSNSSTKGGRFGSAVASTKAPGNADNVSKNENEPEHENDDDDDDDENDDDENDKGSYQLLEVEFLSRDALHIHRSLYEIQRVTRLVGLPEDRQRHLRHLLRTGRYVLDRSNEEE